MLVIYRLAEPKCQGCLGFIFNHKGVSWLNKLSFNNLDSIVNTDGKKELIEAPKDIATLEAISEQNHLKRKMEEMEDDDDDKLSILDEEVKIDELLDINNLFPQKPSDDIKLDDIEDFKL